MSDSIGQNAVVCVGDTKGPSVSDKASLLLRKKKKVTEVKALRGRLTAAESTKNPVEDGSSEVRNSPPSSEGNAIWAGTGVAGTYDGDRDVLNREVVEKSGINSLVILI
jgi:hypothetical protein